MKKPKTSFVEFTSTIRGYYFTLNGKRIYNYQLYWNGYNPDDLMKNRTKFVKNIRIDKESLN